MIQISSCCSVGVTYNRNSSTRHFHDLHRLKFWRCKCKKSQLS